MVFCASLPPCPRLYKPADISCHRLNRRSTLEGGVRKYIHDTTSMSSDPSTKPSSGEIKINETVLSKPSMFNEPHPDFAHAEPINPPISACDELGGMPWCQVMIFQPIAPASAPKITY